MESFNQNVTKHKTGLLNLASERGNISKACKIMGFSRDTFYRYQTAQDSGGVEALFAESRRKPNLKNRVEEATEHAIIEFAIEFPAHGQVRASNELYKEGVSISPSGVRSIWLRYNLESMKKRLRALEEKSAKELSFSQKPGSPSKWTDCQIRYELLQFKAKATLALNRGAWFFFWSSVSPSG